MCYKVSRVLKTGDVYSADHEDEGRPAVRKAGDPGYANCDVLQKQDLHAEISRKHDLIVAVLPNMPTYPPR